MPTEVSKICPSSARASTRTCMMLSSVRSRGGGDERAAAEAGSLVRVMGIDVGGDATIISILFLNDGGGLSMGFRVFEIGKELREQKTAGTTMR